MNFKRKPCIVAGVVVAVFALGSVAFAQVPGDSITDRIMLLYMQFKIGEQGEVLDGDVPLGAIGDMAVENYIPIIRYNDGYYSTKDIETTSDLIVGDDATISGLVRIAGSVINTADTITATTTLTTDSSNIQLLPASAVQIKITLPAVTSGLHYTFVVTGALTGAAVQIASAEGDNIEGILMVNDADVACAGEDFLNIVTDGEVVGDRVELVSDGTSWYIMDSDIDAAAKMTCTDPS